eukprot:701070-Amphidinium_carterae.2
MRPLQDRPSTEELTHRTIPWGLGGSVSVAHHTVQEVARQGTCTLPPGKYLVQLQKAVDITQPTKFQDFSDPAASYSPNKNHNITKPTLPCVQNHTLPNGKLVRSVFLNQWYSFPPEAGQFSDNLLGEIISSLGWQRGA